jgi:hypothetical protein
MIKSILFRFSFVAAMLLALASCYPSSTAVPLNNIIDTNAKYVLNSFVNNGVENNTKFDGYTFQFGANGIVSASKAGIVTQGNWSVSADSLVIRNFVDVPFSGLNEKWKVNGIGNGKIDVAFSNGLDVKTALWKQ